MITELASRPEHAADYRSEQAWATSRVDISFSILLLLFSLACMQAVTNWIEARNRIDGIGLDWIGSKEVREREEAVDRGQVIHVAFSGCTDDIYLYSIYYLFWYRYITWDASSFVLLIMGAWLRIGFRCDRLTPCETPGRSLSDFISYHARTHRAFSTLSILYHVSFFLLIDFYPFFRHAARCNKIIL